MRIFTVQNSSKQISYNSAVNTSKNDLSGKMEGQAVEYFTKVYMSNENINS